MSIRFSCPVCKTSYTVRDADSGKKAECKKCGQRIQVPIPIPQQRNKTVLGDIDSDDEPIDLTPITYVPDPAPASEPTPVEHQPELPPEYDRPRGQPGKVQAIAFMLLLGGGFAIAWVVGWVILSACVCFAWPGTYYSIVFGIMAIIRGAELFGRSARRHSPRTLLMMQVIAVVSLDPVNLTCGIVGMVFLNDPDVDRYFKRGGAYD
jgi:predicted Zn finger-like uncharacterized protein